MHSEINLLIEQSTEYKRIYDQMVTIWNNSTDLQKLEHLDNNDAVLQLETKLAELKHPTEQVNPEKSNFKRWIAAAAAVLLIGAGWYLLYQQNSKVNYLVKTTGGTIDSVTLNDGSKIFLDQFSQLKYPEKFKGDTREISLVKGQAFFKIHRDTLHPFVVQINQSLVTVLGTSFNINNHNRQIALNVKTGVVKFQPDADRADGSILHAGTGIIYSEIDRRQVILTADNQNSQAWLTHQLQFVDASLTDVCRQLQEYYKVKIVIAGNISAFKKLNATFKDNKLNDIMVVLQNTYPIKIKQLSSDSIVVQSILK
ncbi:FecR family protein [Mucilaginibacter paludis]|uniref:Anti-FecI sigma factor, FecR n=1 Tax=Mucilaginibacter paludis DSM 18603 TaxID=714943 RepID=H1YCZ1_9SPHI|nr:FecR domain-containing protein [Mucilaginibacter paludis]EHQ25162.1 anti-FecI sigma factor, FecR [Mucilaginibacter paludis DSM 18603]